MKQVFCLKSIKSVISLNLKNNSLCLFVYKNPMKENVFWTQNFVSNANNMLNFQRGL